MQVILITDVKKVGQRGQLITVADGYAMNVLIPQKKAVPATAENLKRHQQGVVEAKQKADQSVAKAKELLAQINGKSVTIDAKASDAGTLFKSLHASDIAAAIKKDLSVEVPETSIKLEHPIKQKGTHEVSLELLGARATVGVVI